MGVNQANNDLENRLVNMINDLQKQILDLRTRQRMGADGILTQTTGTYLFGPLTLPAGATGYFSITTSPNIPTLTVWNPEFTVYVDSNGLFTFAYPGGSLLSSAQKKMRMSVWLDWDSSNDVTGSRNYKVVIENYDVSSHDYYIHYENVSPALPIN